MKRPQAEQAQHVEQYGECGADLGDEQRELCGVWFLRGDAFEVQDEAGEPVFVSDDVLHERRAAGDDFFTGSALRPPSESEENMAAKTCRRYRRQG